MQAEVEGVCIRNSDEGLAVVKRKGRCFLHCRRAVGANLGKVGRGIEKTQFSRTLKRHKIIVRMKMVGTG